MAAWPIWIHRPCTIQLFRTDSLYRPRNSVTAAVLGHCNILFCFTFFFLPSPPVSLILFLASYYILHLFPFLITLLDLLLDLAVEWLFGRSLIQISTRRPTDFLRNFSQSLQVNIRTVTFQRFYWFCMLPRLCLFVFYFFFTMLITDLGFSRPPRRGKLRLKGQIHSPLLPNADK